MKYTHIAAALGWEETPDTQEGLFLQPEEAAAIDKVIGNNASNEKAAEELATAKETIIRLEGEATATAEKTTALNNRITELEAENKTLGAQSSGNGTTLETKEDTNKPEEKSGKMTLNSPDHPLNQFANRKIAASKK